MNSRLLKPAGGLAALVLALSLPWLLPNKGLIFDFAVVWVFAIAVLGLNILTGYSGQISLGNGAFMAVGGYTTAILIANTHVNYLVTIPLAGLVAAVVGGLFGLPALRLSGLYLALATFSLAVATPTVIKKFDVISIGHTTYKFTQGHEGINLPAIKDPTGFLIPEAWMYYLFLLLTVPLFLYALGLARSRTGRALHAIRDNEIAAKASGINVAFYKVMAFAFSAFYAGVAGSLFALANAYVNPDSYDLPLSLALLVGAVIGGLGTVSGPILGAIFVVFLPIYSQQIPNPFSRGSTNDHLKPDIIYGLALILLMYLMPYGLAGLALRLWLRVTDRGREPRELAPTT